MHFAHHFFKVYQILAPPMPKGVKLNKKLKIVVCICILLKYAFLTGIVNLYPTNVTQRIAYVDGNYFAFQGGPPLFKQLNVIKGKPSV